MFWSNKPKLPVTEDDKNWIEDSLLWLSNEFGQEYFKGIETITPSKKYFDYNFTGQEEDADFILEKVLDLMNIKGWDIELMFYSEQPQEFGEGLVATPSDNLKGNWKGSSGKYLDKGFGKKEIWIEIGQLQNPQSLIATISHELAHYKLLGEGRIQDNDENLTDLTSIAFGFGIFISNSLFNFSQFSGNSHQGWQMNNQGYLPEQIVAYSMAWLTRYRNEKTDISEYLNKSTLKFYKQSIDYIDKYPDKIRNK
jgi:hypothetical protein